MANNCGFDMNITGQREACEELVRMLKRKDEFEKNGLGRVYEFIVYETEKEDRGNLVTIKGSGDCAWSLLTALRDDNGKRHPSLESETKRLGLAIEAYSSEPGCKFQEHLLINKGIVILDECVDYEEHWIEGMNEETLKELCTEKEISLEELKDLVNDNGDYCVGGFEEWEFQDLTKYFEREKVAILDLRERDAWDYDFMLASHTYEVSEHTAEIAYKDSLGDYILFNGTDEQANEYFDAYCEKYNLELVSYEELEKIEESISLEEKVNYYRATVAEQIYGLYDAGYLTKQQYNYVNIYIDNITKEYVAKSDAWEQENGKTLDVAEDMDIMHGVILDKAKILEIIEKIGKGPSIDEIIAVAAGRATEGRINAQENKDKVKQQER